MWGLGWFRNKPTPRKQSASDPGDVKAPSSTTHGDTKSPLAVVVPASTILREAIAPHARTSAAVNLLRAIPDAQLSEVLGYVGFADAKVAGRVATFLQCHAISERVVLLDYTQDDVLFGWKSLLGPTARRAPTELLARFLAPFSKSARRLVLRDLHLNEERQGMYSTAEYQCIQTTLPLLEEIDLEGQAEAISLKQLLPTRASRLTRVRFALSGPWVHEWLAWTTHHEYQGPLQAFAGRFAGYYKQGDEQRFLGELKQLQSQWLDWEPKERPTEVEFDFSDMSSISLSASNMWFKEVAIVTPHLTRLRLRLPGAPNNRNVVSSLLHALATANQLHTRLLELQLSAESGDDSLDDDVKRILSECRSLEILTLGNLFEFGFGLSRSRRDEVPIMDGLDALVHVNVPSELLELRSQNRPWPRLESLYVHLNLTRPVDKVAADRQLARAPSLRTIVLHGRVSISTGENWIDFVQSGLTWRKIQLFVEWNGEFTAPLYEWIRVNSRLESLRLNFHKEPLKSGRPGASLDDEFLASWVLPPIPTTSSSEPSRPVRPLRELILMGANTGIIMKASNKAISAFCTACPMLERLEISVNALDIQPDDVKTLLLCLPRLYLLYLGDIPGNGTTGGWSTIRDLVIQRRRRLHVTVTFSESRDERIHEGWPIKPTHWRFDHT